MTAWYLMFLVLYVLLELLQDPIIFVMIMFLWVILEVTLITAKKGIELFTGLGDHPTLKVRQALGVTGLERPI